MLQSLFGTRTCLVTDGAMGTELFKAGLEPGTAPEVWNRQRPEEVRRIHQAYVDAGADVLLTNSFGANRLRLELNDLHDQVDPLNSEAAAIARDVADGANRPVFVAGSIGPTGRFGSIAVATLDVRPVIVEQARSLNKGGVDVFWIETIGSLSEAEQAIEAVQSVSDLPVVVTMHFSGGGVTPSGVSAQAAARRLVDLGVSAVGANCSDSPQATVDALTQMSDAVPGHPLVSKGNAGLPNPDPMVDSMADPDEFAAQVIGHRALGAMILGGCCGTSPAHVARLRQALDSEPVSGC